MTFRRQNILMLSLFCSIGFAADPFPPETHRSVLHRLTRESIDGAIAHGLPLPQSALSVSVGNSPLNDAVRSVVIRTFVEKRLDVYDSDDGADTILTVVVSNAALQYGRPFSTSLFGARKVEREISVTSDIAMVTKVSRRVLYSSVFTRSARDTVLLSDVHLLDDPSVPFTAVTLPELSFFESVLEPAIITVASAVAVYLFFTIRS